MVTETADEIMEATSRALCTHGYADLTIQRIADESSLSTAAIHYHFDTKRALLEAFLDHLIEQFEERLACEASDPRERLTTLLGSIYASAEGGNDDFAIALMELKAQAPYHDPYRERFVALDEQTHAVVASAVRDGVDAGHFDPVDPDAVARFVVTAINGGHVRQVALGESPSETRQVVADYLEQRLGWKPEVVA